MATPCLHRDRAQQLLHTAKPIYYAISGMHSPETGGPEMLIELAYRLIVEETPFIQTIRNNSFVELPLYGTLNPDRYHRATVDICYGGGFSFADAPGGGMVGRFAWFDEGGLLVFYNEAAGMLLGAGTMALFADRAAAGAVSRPSMGVTERWRAS